MKGLYNCIKCGKNRTSYYQMQTRGADEPMTLYFYRIMRKIIIDL